MALRIFFLFLLLFVFIPLQTVSESPRHELRIQTLVPLRNPVFWGAGVIPAMQMAVDKVNQNQSVLPNYNLTSFVSDTQCDSSEGTWKLIKSILDTDVANETRIITFLGGSCSLSTEPTAALSGRLYKVVQVSYASYSPVLSDRLKYPLFLRTSPSELLYNDARYALMKKYDWCFVATLHQTANFFSLAVQDFHDNFKETLAGPGSRCNKTGSNSPVLFSFTGDPEIPLMQIKNKRIRIIYGFFYEDKALVVMCYAYRMGLTTDNHLWILPSWYSEGWWDVANTLDWSPYNVNCRGSDIVKAVKFSILLDLYMYLPPGYPGEALGGYTNATFFEEYFTRRDEYFNVNSSTDIVNIPSVLYTTLIYDAVWAIALALDETENQLQEMGKNLTQFRYSDSTDEPTFSSNVSNMILNNMQKLDFYGISGRVRFDENGTRIALTAISQYLSINNDTSLKQVQLGTYDRLATNLTLNFTTDPIWKLGRPPADRSMPESKLLSPPLIYSMDVIIAIGILIAIGFLIFNTVTIRKPLIANSAPFINSVITVGCIVMMSSSILLGIDSGTPQVINGTRVNVLAGNIGEETDRYAIICTVRLWLLSIGFTLSFGALFAKTWQVYRVYTKSDLKDKPLKPWNFLIIMGILLTIDVLFLSIWTGLFPFRHAIKEIDNAESNILYKYEKCECSYFSYLIGALYVYKGLLVVFGLFLAYESRNVKYLYINDSRFVSISMYIVVILIGISAPLSLVLADRYIIDPAYVIAVIMIVTACMSCLCILYIPKFVYMAKGQDTMLPKTKAEVFTPVDNLQLGHTDVNPEDVQSAEQEIKYLKEQVKQREIELSTLNRRGSDQDSGVLCVSVDEPTESVSNGSGPDSPSCRDNETITMDKDLPSTSNAIEIRKENKEIEEETREGNKGIEEGRREENKDVEEGRREDKEEDNSGTVLVLQRPRKKTVTIVDKNKEEIQ